MKFKDLQNNLSKQVKTKVLVDATGSERKVLNEVFNKERCINFTGMEYHIEVSPLIYEKFVNSMNFYLGHKWMPQGYAWIFSMAPCRLKVGLIRYFQNKIYVPHHPTFQPYFKQLLNLCGSKEDFQILDKHGKTIYYTKGQKDRRYEGPVLSIGDAISAINPLGCEGIRHALVTGRKAASEIEKFLAGEVTSFKGYDREINSYFGKKWYFSELFMKNLFTNKNDILIDRTVEYFRLMDKHQIMEVVFHYRFFHTLKSYFWYFVSQIKDLLWRWKSKHESSS